MSSRISPDSKWAAEFFRRTVTENPYLRRAVDLVWEGPSPKQYTFLTYPSKEILYGGAAGGGKSIALLAAALQFATVPGYSAILLRRTFADLTKPKSLIPLSQAILSGRSDASYHGTERRWTFSSGATLSFGYLDTEVDKYIYQGAEFQYIGFDELTQFQETQYTYLISRLRKPTGFPVPLRVRASANPGGVGHDWVYRRFVNPETRGSRVFIPARLEDNARLDRESYEESLQELDPVTRRQLRHGDWEVRPEGEMFKRHWFEVVPVDRVPRMERSVRRWDLAATATDGKNDPDWTAGGLMGKGEDGRHYLQDVQRIRGTSKEVESLVRQTAECDGAGVSIRIEQEPGSAGKALVEHYARSLARFDCRGVPSTGDKVTRARPFSAACERGDVRLVAGRWNTPFLDELCAFPSDGCHDDQVDMATGGYSDLTGETFSFRILDTAPAPASPDNPRRPDPDAGWTRAWSREG